MYKVSLANEPTSPARRDGSPSKKASRRGSPASGDNKFDHRMEKSVVIHDTISQNLDEEQEKEQGLGVIAAKNDEKLDALKKIVPDLIEAVLINAYEPLDKKIPNDVPRIKAIDWPVMLKKSKASCSL